MHAEVVAKAEKAREAAPSSQLSHGSQKQGAPSHKEALKAQVVKIMEANAGI